MQISLKRTRQTGSAHALVMLVFVLVIASSGSFAYFKVKEKNDEAKATQQASEAAKTGEETPTVETAPPSAADSLATVAAAQKPCGFTVSTAEDPLYVSGTRLLSKSNLNYDDLAGTPIRIAGYVYGAEDNSSPVSKAKVELWQADDAGLYHPAGGGAASKYDKDQLSLRGYVTTNSKGYYEFDSILPGELEDRVRHIGVKITASGYTGISSRIITAQPGDMLIPTDDDSADALPSQCAWLKFDGSTADADGRKTGVYNIHLQKK